jgi:hypothetical protein
VGYGPPPNTDALCGAMTNAFDIDTLSTFVYTKLGKRMEEVAPSGTIDARVVAVLQWVDREQQERVLIDALQDALGHLGDMAAVLDRVRKHLDRMEASDWYHSPDPLQTCFIRSDEPFLDRTQLRESLDQILYRRNKRTLVVRGPIGSGRTYSTHVVAELAAPDESVFPLDVQTLDPGFTPDDLARVIAISTGCAPAVVYIPPPGGTTATHNAELVGWLVSEIAKGDRPWWVLLDGLDKVDLRPETIDFVIHLMRQAEMSDRHLRVALLGCGDVLPPDLERLVCQERLGEIGRSHLEEFFERLADHTGMPIEPEQIAVMTETVLDGLPDSGGGRLEAISDRVRTVAKMFAQGPDGGE